jgi:hypothetical protein
MDAFNTNPSVIKSMASSASSASTKRKAVYEEPAGRESDYSSWRQEGVDGNPKRVRLSEGDEDGLKRMTGPISLAAFAAGYTTTGVFSTKPPNETTRPMLSGIVGRSTTAGQIIPANLAPQANFSTGGLLPALNQAVRPVVGAASVNSSKYSSQDTRLERLMILVFTTPPPPRISPWPFNFPAATHAYAHPTTCPIDWSQLSGLETKHILTYELRAPWNPAPLPWAQVATQYQQATGEEKLFSQEGTRKRFKKVNRAIFEATGVYFLYSGLGLQEDYNVPNDTDMPQKMREAGLINDPVTRGKKFSNKSKTSNWSKNSHRETVCESEAVVLVIQPPGQSSYASRLISKKIIKTLRITSDQVVPFSVDTFDRWHTCLCFGTRHTLPKRVYKLKQMPEGYAYVDEGIPPVTIHTLLDTYRLSRFMGTTAVSDMILDGLHEVFKNEKGLFLKYQIGAICEGDCNDVMRFLDLEPDDIEKLWKETKRSDPIRRLIVDLLTHGLGAMEGLDRIRANALRSGSQARDLYRTFARSHREDALDAFANATSPELFYATYHSHKVDEPCYRQVLCSLLSKKWIDDTLDFSNTHLVEIKGVNNCKIINKTGCSLDINALQGQTPHWEWQRICSVNSWILIPPKGPQIRQPRPVYFELDKVDSHGRYPSHPGYNDADWTVVESTNIYEDDDTWETAKRHGIPRSARKVREDETTGELIFDIEDESWVPPRSFATHVEREFEQSWCEFQRYRKWLWMQQGGKIPIVTCRRWRPFNGPAVMLGDDTFRDARRRR